MQLNDFRTLGRSGLVVSPMALGTMTFGDTKFTDRNWAILEGLRQVVEEAGKSLSQTALAWALAQPGITSLIIGASKQEQLHDNLASLEVALTPAQVQKLNEISALPYVFPYPIFTPAINKGIFWGGEYGYWLEMISFL